MNETPSRPEVRARLMKANEEREDSTPIERIYALIHTGADDERHFYLAVFGGPHPDSANLKILNLRYFALSKPESTMSDTFLRNGINMRDPGGHVLPTLLGQAFQRAADQRDGSASDYDTLFTRLE